MFRYMAFAWNASQDAQAEIAQQLAARLQLTTPGWTGALVLPGLKIFHCGTHAGSSEALALSRNAGVILGTMFEPCGDGTAAPLRKRIFTAAQTDRILSTGCRSLISDYWGRYVAFAHDATQRRTYILRDPTGGLPCLNTSHHGVELYFSCAEDCAALGLIELSIDWEFIARRVACDNPSSHRTAIRQIAELRPGEQVQVHQGRTARTLLWNPWRVAQTSPIENAATAAHELRRVGKACIQSWGSCYRGVLHLLSGGLNSSIVLGGLHAARSGPSITCLNYHSRGTDGDERYFARLAANHARVPLLEWERDNALRLEDMLTMQRSATPGSYVSWLQTGRREARLAREISAEAIFSGSGGDELFFRTHGLLGAADYLQTRGLDRHFIAVALDAAHMENCSVWRVMRETLHRRRIHRRQIVELPSGDRRRLVASDAIACAPVFYGAAQTSMDCPYDIPPGKWAHVQSLTIPWECYDPLGCDDTPQRVHPLISQPLIELCLRIPTYVLLHKGWDRAIARQAFHYDVPQEILRRRCKLGLQENVAEMLNRNVDAIRELLLEGHLVEERLLNRASIEKHLDGQPVMDGNFAREVFDHISTEAWLRSWKAPAMRPARRMQAS